MRDHTRWEDEMYRTYLLHRLGNESGIVDYEEFDQFELLVIFEDGEKELFNILDHTTRKIIPDRQDVLEMGEKRYTWEFAFKLRSKMQCARLSCEKLSEMTGISRPSLSGYLNGKRLPGLYNTIKLADALGCDVNEFLRIPK